MEAPVVALGKAVHVAGLGAVDAGRPAAQARTVKAPCQRWWGSHFSMMMRVQLRRHRRSLEAAFLEPGPCRLGGTVDERP